MGRKNTEKQGTEPRSMTFGFFRARILTHFRAAALGFEPKLPGSLAIVSVFSTV